MTEGSDDQDKPKPGELSLDPSTWMKKTAAADALQTPKTADAGSYDPSTWMKGAAKAPPVAETMAADEKEAAVPAPPSRRLLLIGGGGAGLLALGGAGFLLTRKQAGVPAAGAVASSKGATEKQVVTLPNLAALAPALVAYGLSAEDAGKISAAAGSVLPAAAAAMELRLDLDLSRIGDKASLAALSISRPDGSGARVTPGAAGFAVAALAATTRQEVKVARGQMDSESFYSSAVSAGLSDVLIPAFFQAFVFDFDFQREIEPGDAFEAAFTQTVNERGEPVGGKTLIYASMNTKTKSRALYRFTSQGDKEANWYDGAGKNIRRSLMKTPVEGARISSTFGPRTHPVLGYTRIHKGTDFATPVGTPVFASGGGKVTFVGVHGGHGNYVAIEHSPTLATSYAHLSQYGAGIAVGAEVVQGQQIALTGNTGLSSGPHLHYELFVDGQQVDSQTYQTEEGRALTGAEMAAFATERDRIDAARTSSL